MNEGGDSDVFFYLNPSASYSPKLMTYNKYWEKGYIEITKEQLLKIVNAKDVECKMVGTNYTLYLNSSDLKPIQKRWKYFVNGKLKPFIIDEE